jgi:hypothetical protein
MKIYEVTMGTDAFLVRAPGIPQAAKKLCAHRGMTYGKQTGKYSPGQTGDRARFDCYYPASLFQEKPERVTVYVKPATII